MANSKTDYQQLAGRDTQYTDDFDPKQNFMRILFNPSRAVQARELTQLQTILHQQNKSLANHIFRNNTTITGSRISIKRNKAGAFLEQFFVLNENPTEGESYFADPNSSAQDISLTIDETWIGATFGNVDPAVGTSSKQITIDFVDITDPNLPIVYYEYSGENIEAEEIYYFLNNQDFQDLTIPHPIMMARTATVATTDNSQPFKAMVATVEPGVVYAKNHFLEVEEQSVVVSNNPNDGLLQIGFTFDEDIVTEENAELVEADPLDPLDNDLVPLGNKLRDPASGSRNFNAPGAHRYRIKPIFQSYQGTESIPDSFEPFITLEDGKIIKDQSDVQYGDILELLARRMFDQSGSWTVEDFDVTIQKDNQNLDTFIAEIGPGKAYVRGFEIEKLNTSSITMPRARQAIHKQNLDDQRYLTRNFPNVRLRSFGSAIDGGVFTKQNGISIDWFRIDQNESVKILNREISMRNPYKDTQGNDLTDKNIVGEARVISINRLAQDNLLYFDDLSSLGTDIDTARSARLVRDEGLPTESVAWVNFDTKSEGNDLEKPIITGSKSPLLIDLGKRIVHEQSAVNTTMKIIRRQIATTDGSGTISITAEPGSSFDGRRPIRNAFPKTSNSDFFAVEDEFFARSHPVPSGVLDHLSANAWRGVSYGDGWFAAIGNRDFGLDDTVIIQSNDNGVTWQQATLPPLAAGQKLLPLKVNYVGGPSDGSLQNVSGKFWAYIDGDNNPALLIGDPGETEITWTVLPITISAGTSALHGEPQWIEKYGLFWARTGGRIGANRGPTTSVSYSTDGVNWTSTDIYSTEWEVTHGNVYSEKLDKWLVVGMNPTFGETGRVYIADGDLRSSPTWTRQEIAPDDFYDCFEHDGTFYAAGASGKIYVGVEDPSDPSGISWTANHVPEITTGNGVTGRPGISFIVHDGFKFWASGGWFPWDVEPEAGDFTTGVILSSQDGVNWEYNDSVTDVVSNGAYHQIAFGDDTFVAVGNNDSVVSSKRQKTNDFFINPDFLTYDDLAPIGELIVSGFPDDGTPSDFELYIAYLLESPTRRTKTLLSNEEVFTFSPGGTNDSTVNKLDLEKEDVYGIEEIYQLTNNVSSLSDTFVELTHGGTTYSNARKLTDSESLHLRLDNGQRATFYGPGELRGWKKLWASPNKADLSQATEYLVRYKYFEHSIGGEYFSVESYKGIEDWVDNLQKIPVFHSEDFGKIGLTQVLDFRRKLSEINVGQSNLIAPNTVLKTDISVYNPYLAKIFLNKNGKFTVREGVPSSPPEMPESIDDSMHICTLSVPPYTFSHNDVATDLIKNTRYTMQDIRKLENRLTNVEDVVSLSMLEQNAMDMKVTDKETGLDRFKSGIFVDNFEGQANSNTLADDFYLSVNVTGQWGQCQTEENNMVMIFDSNASSGGVKEYENVITLNPTGTRVLAENKTATDTTNINPLLFYVWHGQVKVTPAVDTWQETRYLPTRRRSIGGYAPPPGFNPNWQVDSIETDWVGIDGDMQTIREGNSVNVSGSQGTTRPIDRNFQQQAEVLKSIISSLGSRDLTSEERVRNPKGIDFADGELQAVLDEAIRAGEVSAVKWGQDLNFDPRSMLNTAILGLRGSLGGDSVIRSGGEISNEQIAAILQVGGWENNTESSAILGSTSLNAQGIPEDIAALDGRRGSQTMAEILADRGEQPSDLGWDADNDGTRSSSMANSIGSNRAMTWRGANRDTFEQAINSGTVDRHIFDTATQVTQTRQTRDALRMHTRQSSSNRLVSREAIPWMRPNTVTFEGEGFRPGMTVFGILDNRKVEVVPAPGFDNGNGEPRVNSDGTVKGEFIIPERTFTAGEKQFLLIDEDQTSQGSTSYTARGILNTRQRTITTIRSVPVTQETRLANNIRQIPTSEPIRIDGTNRYLDPIAQSFFVTTEGGCFLKSISVYFATKAGDFRENKTPEALNITGSPFSGATSLQTILKDTFGEAHPTDPLQYTDDGTAQIMNAAVTMYLVEVIDGMPTQNVIPLSQVTKLPADITRNPFIPAAGETEFVFNDPVYLEENAEYAFVLVTPSKEYEVWSAELGQQDIFKNGAEDPGVGIAEQPYLGSLFKSQNSRTWTPEQNKTLTFGIQRYEYDTNENQDVILTDSKFDDVTGDTLYPESITDANWSGNPNMTKIWLSNMYPMIGELLFDDTSIRYFQKFSSNGESGSEFESNELDMRNYIRNQLFNANSSSNEYAINNNSEYRIRAELSTTKANLTPVLDKDQMRVIAIRNEVKGIEPDFSWNTIGYANNTTYTKRDVIDVEGEQYFATSSFATDSSSTFEDYLVSNHFKLLPNNLSVNPTDSSGKTEGNSGVYISNNIRLANPADDVRVIVDTAEPMNNHIEFFYRISDNKPMFTTLKDDFLSSTDMINRRSQVYYMKTDPNLVAPGAPIQLTSVSSRRRENYISISGLINRFIDVDGDDKEKTIAYINGVTTTDIFDDLIVANQIPFIISSEAFNSIVRQNRNIYVWEATKQYNRGDLVWHQGAFWVSNGAMVKTWEKFQDYKAGDLVESGQQIYRALKDINGNILNTNPEQGLNDTWGWMDNIESFFGVGTVPSDAGLAWNRVPSLFFDRKIEREENGQWRRMVLQNTNSKFNNYRDENFYESIWVPELEPNMEFKSFSIKAELKNVETRAIIPKIKKLRAIATL